MVKVNFLCKEVLRAKVFVYKFIIMSLPTQAILGSYCIQQQNLSIFLYVIFEKNFRQLSSQRWENLVEILSSSQGSSGVSAPIEVVNHELGGFPKSPAIN